MYYIYAIRSVNRNYLYVGITDNLERRFNQHQAGYNRTTKPYRPFVLIYSEIVPDRIQARIREKHFKSSAGRVELKQMIIG